MLPESSVYGTPTPGSYAACYKFPISENMVGLFVREPGEYSPTQIILHFFDLEKDSIVESHYAADVFGDAGEVSNYGSCLIRNASDSSFTMITAAFYSYQEIDDTITELSESLECFKITKYGCAKVEMDASEIRKKYPVVVRTLLESISNQ